MEGVCPETLAMMLLDISLKWPERHKQPAQRKKKLCQKLRQLDWQTALWFEHESAGIPFVADRESLFVERWSPLPVRLKVRVEVVYPCPTPTNHMSCMPVTGRVAAFKSCASP